MTVDKTPDLYYIPLHRSFSKPVGGIMAEKTDKKTFMDRNPELRALIAASNVTPEQFIDFTSQIRCLYEAYAANLPDDSAWKRGKIEHAAHGADIVREHAYLLGLRGIEVDVVAFPLFAHETGRLVHEHIRRSSKLMPPWRHGVESALFVEHVFGPFAESKLGRAILLAVRHHSDITMPSLAEFAGSEATKALTGLVRDLDKMAGFDNARCYVGDPEFKRRQIAANFAVQRQRDQTWGCEKCAILPASMLKDFLAGRALERRKCQSYETYMLQCLAWLFDIQNHEALNLCVERGGPRVVLRYLLVQLEKGAPRQLRRLKAWAAVWRDGILMK